MTDTAAMEETPIADDDIEAIVELPTELTNVREGLPFSKAKKRQVNTSWHDLHAAQPPADPSVASAKWVIGDQDDTWPVCLVHTVHGPGARVEAQAYACDYADVYIEGTQEVAGEHYVQDDIHIVRAGVVAGPWVAGPGGAVVLRVYRNGCYDPSVYPVPPPTADVPERHTSWTELLRAGRAGADEFKSKRDEGLYTIKFYLGDEGDLTNPAVIRSQFVPEHVGERHTHAADYVEYFVQGSMEITRHNFRAGDLRLVKATTVYGP
jgi:hypothetical protein